MPKKKGKVVAVSGGFDPVHVGHIRYISEAKRYGDKVVVILNNDNWLKAKKGFVFMPENERAELVSAIDGVDRVIISSHKPHDKDRSVSRELAKLKPDVFANGGDRRSASDIPEVAVCEKYGIKMVFGVGVGGKVQSSSWLTNKVAIHGTVEVRPWGYMRTFESGKTFWIKAITVAPKARLSLQRHGHRSETWTCLEGEVFAEINGKKKKLTLGKSVTFGPRVKHRLSSIKGGTIVEVAHGDDVRESDIERFEDDYGRVK